MAVGVVLRRGVTAFVVGGLVGGWLSAPAGAEPGPAPDDALTAAGGEAAPALTAGAVESTPPAGAVESTPPAVTETPDGWRLELGAKNETQAPIAPLTTALSSREYVVGGTYTGSLDGPGDGEKPQGTLEVGYEIGCGIDMSTSNGVALTGTAAINPSIGLIGTDFLSPFPDGIVPGVGGTLGGGVTVGLKPGFVNVIKVADKEFTGADPWVMVSNFRVKIDGCVGESFIRSYAYLSRTTDMSEAILAWYGVTTRI